MLTSELSSYLIFITMMLIQHSVDPDLIFNTQSRELQAEWFILEIYEKATLNFNMPYFEKVTRFTISHLSSCILVFMHSNQWC